MSRPPHSRNCRCSACHLSADLFPRGPGDRILLPPPSNSSRPPKGSDRASIAPPRPQSTAPDQYRPHRTREPPPPMPPMPPMPMRDPRAPDSLRGISTGTRPPPTPMHPMPAPRPRHAHTPSVPSAQPRIPERNTYTFAPPEVPERPASAMAARRADAPGADAPAGEGKLKWVPPPQPLRWVTKKERVSHFTPPSQYQGTSFRQYVHDGVPPSRTNS